MNQGYKKLIVYQKSKNLVMQIYDVTAKFPKEERFVLLPQMRRAALSILANLVEGYSKSTNEFIRLLAVSIGSINELEAFMDISSDLKYINKKEFNNCYNLISEVKRLLYSYQNTLRKNRSK